jgi:predicted nucleic acid-binding protein
VRTASVAYVETNSALARMRKGNRLSAAQLRATLAALDALWATLYVHTVTDRVIQTAAQATLDHALRAYDALHLAAALVFAEGERIVFACWDGELSEAAGKHGFPLLPERL